MSCSALQPSPFQWWKPPSFVIHPREKICFMHILHKPLTGKVKRKTKQIGFLLVCNFLPTVSIKNWMGPYQRTPVTRAIRYSGLGVRSVGPVGDFLDCWCFCCSYVISLLYWLCCFMTSWLSWLSTFKEILDITTLPIARFKKTMCKSWGIQQQSQIAADAPLLASHREAEARRLETRGIPTGASVARHQKKGDNKASLILSFSLTAGQQLKPASREIHATRLFFKSATAYIAYLAFSDCNVVILKFSRHLGGIFRLKDGLNDVELLNRFCVRQLFQGPGPARTCLFCVHAAIPRPTPHDGAAGGCGLRCGLRRLTWVNGWRLGIQQKSESLKLGQATSGEKSFTGFSAPWLAAVITYTITMAMDIGCLPVPSSSSSSSSSSSCCFSSRPSLFSDQSWRTCLTVQKFTNRIHRCYFSHLYMYNK